LHLNDDGVFVLYNYYREAWLPQKLGGMLQDAFGSAPIITARPGSGHARRRSMIAASMARRHPATPSTRPPDGCAAAGDRRLAVPLPARTLDRPVLPAPLATIVALAALLIGRAHTGVGRRSADSVRISSCWVSHCLLENPELAMFSLLYGTTWLVNALVFFAILASVCWRSSSISASGSTAHGVVTRGTSGRSR
jgi:hypothetical protein